MEIGSDIWVHALVRRVALAGSCATIARKGDARAGAVIVKTFDNRSGKTGLYAQAVGPDGDMVWMRPGDLTAEADADAYIERAVRFDPDLWVVEIEDADGARFLTEAVEGR